MQPEEKKSAKRFIFLLFRLAFRLVAGLLLIIYIFFGINAAKDLYKRDMYRSQDVSYLAADLDKASESGDSRMVVSWLKARPLQETDKLVDIITARSAVLGADVFFEISRREKALGRSEEALFWLELGHFRLLYDVIRCGAEPKDADVFAPVFRRIQSQSAELLHGDTALLKKTVQRILDFDTKYPAHDNPGFICQAITPELPADEINWESYHRALRKNTEELLKDPAKVNIPAEKK
jgi:hypothetical protein